jgi:hypothetical protein
MSTCKSHVCFIVNMPYSLILCCMNAFSTCLVYNFKGTKADDQNCFHGPDVGIFRLFSCHESETILLDLICWQLINVLCYKAQLIFI